MKKILLASTILVGTAGFAAADNANFTFSGEAYLGAEYAYDGAAATGAFNFVATSSFTAGMKTTTDMGLEAGAEIKVTSGGWDATEFNQADGIKTPAGVSAGEIEYAKVYLSGDFGKLTATASADDLKFEYDYTMGDFALNVYYTEVLAADNEAGGKATYTFGDYKVWASIDYTFGVGDWTAKAGAEAKFGAATLSGYVSYNQAGDIGGEAKVAYDMAPYSVSLTYSDTDFSAAGYLVKGEAAYDLGGGVKVKAHGAYNGEDYLVGAGVAMTF